MADRNLSNTGDIRPVPDPTRLTTEQLTREIAALRESGGAAQLALREIIETRLVGNDRAIRLLQDAADKFPAWVDEKIVALKDVHAQRFVALNDTFAEKFASIQTQFSERDVRTEQAAGAVKIAVDAALQAQKEAVGEQNKSSALAIAKSETSTTKQIDQLATSIQQMTKAFDDKVVDVKDRLTRLEGKGEVVDPQAAALAAEVHSNSARLQALSGKSEGIGTSWAVLLAVASLVALFYFNSPKPAPAIDPALAVLLQELKTERAAAAPQVVYVPAPIGTQLPVTPPSTSVPR